MLEIGDRVPEAIVYGGAGRSGDDWPSCTPTGRFCCVFYLFDWSST